jgi:hypothetical protein
MVNSIAMLAKEKAIGIPKNIQMKKVANRTHVRVSMLIAVSYHGLLNRDHE